MQILRKSLCLPVLIMLAVASFGQEFEGSIAFVKKSYYDTTHLNYYIKKNRIRIDKYNRQGGQLIETLLVNLEKETVTALHPEKKLYRPLSVAPECQTSKSDYEVKKTGNFRRINGHKCYQWRVRNEKLNTEIAYWVTKIQFDFYDDLSQPFYFFLIQCNITVSSPTPGQGQIKFPESLYQADPKFVNRKQKSFWSKMTGLLR